MYHPVLHCLFRFVAAVCFFGIAISACTDTGKPIAVVEVDTYDFRLAYEGKDVIHDFIIKNTGKADLSIQAVKTG